MAVLGIDTSCYRTSLAIVGDGAIYADERRLLGVPMGGRGLRQSEALFQHVQHLGELCERAFEKAGDVSIEAVCVSVRPRSADGSYMPVFTAGEMAARAIASATGTRLFTTSHQQGHLRAALAGSGFNPCGDFLAMHVSGGTTEVLKADLKLDDIELLGGTSDLHAGQLVDRIGVLLGLEFPAGPALENLAGPAPIRPEVPTAVNGLNISLSGAEARLKDMAEKGRAKSEVAAELYSFLERSLAKLIEAASLKTGLNQVLIAGGVAASARLRSALEARLSRRGAGVRLYWARPELSGDNAVGAALIGEDKYRNTCVEGNT